MRSCVRCGADLPAGARSDARYCSGRCRVAAHRASASTAPPQLPEELLQLRRWVRWQPEARGAGMTKVPLRTDGRGRASSTGPWSWSPHDVAMASTIGAGLGFVLRHGDGLVCLDLDDVLDAHGAPTPAAATLLARLPATFVEQSVSGRGLHVWGRGDLREGRRVVIDGVRVEAYGHARFVALGQPWRSSTSRLAGLDGVLADLLARVPAPS